MPASGPAVNALDETTSRAAIEDSIKEVTHDLLFNRIYEGWVAMLIAGPTESRWKPRRHRKTFRFKVLHNTIWRPEQNWRRGIRLGSGTAHTELVNNLVHGEVIFEGGEAQMHHNLTGRLEGYFVDPVAGNLALTREATGAIDQGVPDPEATDDIRGRSRVGRPDLGAWEFRNGL